MLRATLCASFVQPHFIRKPASHCYDSGVRLIALIAAALKWPLHVALRSSIGTFANTYAWRSLWASVTRTPVDFYYGPPQWVADVRKNPPRLEEIRRSALDLARELQPDRHARAMHLAAQLDAIAARADELLGHRQTFDQRTSAYFGLTLPDVFPNTDQDRAEIDRQLPGSGSLAERYGAFDRQFLVPADRLAAVMARAIEGCRAQTVRHMQLPATEAVRAEYVHDKPWSAFSRYQGNFQSVVSVNVDLRLTIDRALQLACHEAYPGHHVQNTIQDLRFVRGFHWMEWTVQPTFSPQSLVSEARWRRLRCPHRAHRVPRRGTHA